jgi:multiple sugar transport system ATP-binding protein
MSRVDFEHVAKTFPDGTRALEDLTLAIDDGELLVLVGPSGCGKSTVLRLLAGLETPSAGTIRLDGRVVNDAAPRERNVAMVFQDYALYPHMTVRENLAFPLRMRKLAREEVAQRVAWAAELLELGALLDRLPRQLSGGQRQRVAMGRALVRNPSVSLLDEPLSNLDAVLRVSVRAEIEALQRKTRTTMLYVTHDQVEAMTLGDRVAVLHEGRLQQVDVPRALYERPANVFVAGFVGSPPMNLFEAQVERDAAGRPALAIGKSQLALPDALAPAVERHARVTAGVRPEHVEIAEAGASGALPARVEHAELLGHETLVHVQLEAGLVWVARVGGMASLERGAAVALRILPAGIHAFEPDGARIG